MSHAVSQETPLLIVWLVTGLLVNGVLWKVFQLSVAGQNLIYFASLYIRLGCEKNPLLFLLGVQKLLCSFNTSHCLDTSLHFALLRGKTRTFSREIHWIFLLSEWYWSQSPFHYLSAKKSGLITAFISILYIYLADQLHYIQAPSCSSMIKSSESLLCNYSIKL